MQLSQVAQQGALTGNYMQALAIQAPDLGLAFGAIGTAAGVAAMALLPMISNLFDAGSALDDVSEGLDDVSGRMDSLEGNARDLSEMEAT